ncbi:hypothetical protein CBR_g18772 [Chara braunii]|uniref:Uncharacterized protein n=1 Tax=Chara braunii TaxID=69332 RepID=A0A388KWF0_CHABU|nr:hypothetical protein CBR_g18772 [Chara braunii]|eukprot:GBG74361.1 hypothetical protein CBR_g18772 [Chara braunii]
MSTGTVNVIHERIVILTLRCRRGCQWVWHSSKPENTKLSSRVTGQMYHAALSCGMGYTTLTDFCLALGMRGVHKTSFYMFSRGMYGFNGGWCDVAQRTAEKDMTEAIERVRKEYSNITVLLDGRYDSSRDATHCTVTVMHYETRLILGVETIRKRPGESSWTLETTATRNVLIRLLRVHNLPIQEVVHDDKASVSAVLLRDQKDMWHKAKNLAARFEEQLCMGRRELPKEVDDCDTLSPLVKKVNEGRVVDIVESLCLKLLTGKDQQRDIASIALKKVVLEISTGTVAQCVVVALTPKLTDGICAPESSTEVQSECLDILCDLLHRFGVLMVADHERVLATLLNKLDSNFAGLRKRVTQCLATLASNMSDVLLAKATSAVITHLKNKSLKSEFTRTNIQAVGSLCRAVGYRFGAYLGEVAPLLIGYCREASENDDELRENSLQALESFLLRCPRDVAVHCETILDLALEYLSYDPNFTDDMDEDNEEEMEELDEEDEDSGDEYTDDEDVSWKVRRAAAKCLSAVICSRAEMLSTVYHKGLPKIIERFREREENVKIDIFNTFNDLLRQTGNISKGAPETTSSSPLCLLQQDVPKVVRSLNRQLREKSVKSKIGVFWVLKELVSVLPHSLADHVPSLVPGIERVLNDKTSNSNLKIEALVFARMLMASHHPEVFHPHIKPPQFEFAPFVHPLYTVVLKRLMAQDQDQEVKECAISCMGIVVSMLGDHLRGDLATCLPILLDRLRNEITRLTAVKAFAVIAESPLGIDLSIVLEPVVTELTTFLRKANRALRQASLFTLNSLVRAYGSRISGKNYDAIITELSSLISESDLHMSALALELCRTMVLDKKRKTAGTTEREKVLPQALELVRSSLLQGQALETLQSFFAALVQAEICNFESLLSALMAATKSGPGGASVSKQAYHSIARCSAVLCLTTGRSKCSQTVSMLINNLKAGTGSDSVIAQSLDSLGNIELAQAEVDKVLRLLFAHCESEEEGVRNVVAECLGKLALILPSKIVPALKERTASPSAFTKATVVTAIKFTSVERPQPIDEHIKPCIDAFLNLIKDEDRHVRRAAVSALSTAAHNKPSLIADLLPSLLPLLYDQTEVKKELMREVDLGPFKHKVDDGLELRKAAFECVDTLIDTCLDKIDPSQFITPYLLNGLQDPYEVDVKMPCHLILSKLAERCGPAVLAVLDELVEPLEKTVTKKPKKEAVKQEVDRNEDMIRSALRAVNSLSRINNVETCARFKLFMTSVVKAPPLLERYNAVRQETDTIISDGMDLS